jgi:ATP-dependent exoDNAse (exonuclease V) beta subunit
MFLKFVEFWETFNPKLIETEVHLFSDELQVAGTCDLICEINGELWLIDFKTSNQVHSTYPLQTAVYSQCYKECYGKEIQRQGILWLKSSKRKANKEKMQGKGWEIVESDRTQVENLEIFKIVKRLFELENPDAAPAYESFKLSAKRENI